jgi:ribonuclease P protein component
VSKRVGSAVTRNLVKRRIRNAFATMNITDGWDVVVTAKPQSSLVSYTELVGTIEKSIKHLGVKPGASSSPPRNGAVV